MHKNSTQSVSLVVTFYIDIIILLQDDGTVGLFTGNFVGILLTVNR